MSHYSNINLSYLTVFWGFVCEKWRREFYYLLIVERFYVNLKDEKEKAELLGSASEVRV